jgi:hypothetical protein
VAARAPRGCEVSRPAGHQLSDIMTIPAGQRDGQRRALPVDDQVVPAAGPGPVDRRWSGVSPPLGARTCEPSIAASCMSNRPAARSSASSISCRCDQTPASVQSRRRREAVTPIQLISSAGTCRHLGQHVDGAPRAARSSAGNRPGYRCCRGGRAGNSGATRSHKSSGTRTAGTQQNLPTEHLTAKPHTDLHRHSLLRNHTKTCSVPVCKAGSLSNLDTRTAEQAWTNLRNATAALRGCSLRNSQQLHI